MANLEGKLSQAGTVIVYTAGNVYLQALLNSMRDAGKTEPSLKNAYLSKYGVAEELRSRLKDEFRLKAPPNVSLAETTKPLLDTGKSFSEIASQASSFDELEKYLNDCVTNAPGAFEPPLKKQFTTSDGVTVYPLPNTTTLDPRRFARIFYFETPFTKDQFTWLINNAPLYGFLPYEDYALYYVGFNQIKTLVAGSGVQKTLSRFQSTPITPSQITVSAAAISTFPDPSQPVVEKTPNGTMYFSGAANPLLVVFGGINVPRSQPNVPSGQYMPKYFESVFNKYNIWIANSNAVNGPNSYTEVLQWLSGKGVNPSQKLLYCFSGGNAPGAALIASGQINDFNKVILVDIWMKGDNRWPNWVKGNASKVSYFYTLFGPGGGAPNGTEQQNAIKTALGYPASANQDTLHYSSGVIKNTNVFAGSSAGDTHMAANVMAVSTL